MPTSRRGEWEHLLGIEDKREKRTKLEEYLDRGVGACWLREPQFARLTEGALLHFHQERYELLAWCVMPNHVHVLVHVWRLPLDQMIQSWKRFVATRALRLLRLECRTPIRHEPAPAGTTPNRSSALQSFWEREYWDTFMRDEEQEGKSIGYIESNPMKAKLCRNSETWPFGSGRFRDAYRRLVLPRSTRPS
jgi:REP element-mobilizing transposase RayT